MKTTQSFFPTRTHLQSRQIKREKTYQLIKKQDEDQDSNEDDDFTINIFRNTQQQQPRSDLELTIDRPVGGIELFRKMELAGKDRQHENRRHSKRSNKESTQRNISSSHFNNNRFRKDKSENEDRENQDSYIKPINEVHNSQTVFRSSLPDQTFKSHVTYNPQASSIKPNTRQLMRKTSDKSQVVFRPATSKTSSKNPQVLDEWASQQRRQYQDKAALLNQINYNRPLVQKYGDRYFQYLLRNRFQQDLKPPAFIYQIGSNKFSESRVIQKIKKYRPQIREKEMMVVRGKKVGYLEA